MTTSEHQHSHPNTTGDKLERLPAAGEALGYGETTVRRLIREGRLRAVRIDGVLRVPRSAIDEFIADLPPG